MNLTDCQRYGFFSVLAANNSRNLRRTTCIENSEDLPFIHESDRGAPEASDVQQLIGYINTRGKKYARNFTRVVTTFLRAENLCKTPQFM